MAVLFERVAEHFNTSEEHFNTKVLKFFFCVVN